jgi:hypothetical protein
MSTRDVDRLLTTWLAADAPPREPDHLLGMVLARTSQTHRRPGWLIPERWLSVQLTMRWRPAPSVMPIALVVVLLLLAGLVVAVVGSPKRLPAPFGPADNGSLAYMSGPQIVIGPIDGSSPRAITASTAMAGEPVFSPLGTHIAYKLYATTDSTNLASLMIVPIAGGDPVQIEGFVGSLSTPSWSPDQRFITYSRRAGDSFSERIMIAPSDGSASSRVIGPDEPGVAAHDPVFSPDGQRIAYVHWGVRFARISVMDVDGMDRRDLTANRFSIVGGGAQHGGPDLAWDPTGRWLLVSAARSSDSPDGRDVFVVDVDGATGVTEIAAGPVLEYGATWSPQGIGSPSSAATDSPRWSWRTRMGPTRASSTPG